MLSDNYVLEKHLQQIAIDMVSALSTNSEDYLCDMDTFSCLQNTNGSSSLLLLINIIIFYHNKTFVNIKQTQYRTQRSQYTTTGRLRCSPS